jgi:hypothetical protein
VLKEQREQPAHPGQTSSVAHAPALKVLRNVAPVRVARHGQALRIAQSASEFQIVATMARPKANSAAALARAVHRGQLAVASAAISLLVNAPPARAKAQIARASVQQQAPARHASDRAVPRARRVMASGRHAALAEAKREAPGPTVPSASRGLIVVQIVPPVIVSQVDQAALSAVQADQRVPQDVPVAQVQRVPALSAARHVATENHAHPSVIGRRARKATGPSSGRILPLGIVPQDAHPAARHPAPTDRSADSRLVHARRAPVHDQKAATAQRGLSVPAASALADSASQVAGPKHLASPASVSRPIASLQAIELLRGKQAQSVPVRRVPVRRGPHSVPLRGPAPAHASPSANRVQGVQLPEDHAPQVRARAAPPPPQVPASRVVPVASANQVALANPAHLASPALPVGRPPREASVTSSHAASPRLPNVRPRNVPAASQLPNANRAAKETKAS